MAVILFLQRLADGFVMKQSDLGPLMSTIRRILLQQAPAQPLQSPSCGLAERGEPMAARTGLS